MPSLTTTTTTTPIATTTQTTEVKLKPVLRRKLLTELKVYGELKSQLNALEAAMKKHRTSIEACMVESGEQSLAIDGYKSTMVFPSRSKLDKKKFVALGGSLELLEQATISTPGKPYVKVTLPGEKDGEYEE